MSLLVCAVLFVITFTLFFISSPECAHLSLSTCKPLFMFWHLILCCPSPCCIPHVIIKCRMTILIKYFLASQHGFSHMKTARLVRWHHSLPTFGSEIALSARISAPSFAVSPRCAFTLTKKVAVPAAILFRGISMAAAKISVSGAPTNVSFPPSTIHLLAAFSNNWLSHKYSNGSLMNFAFEIRRESNPRSYLTRSSTLTTRPTVYIRLVPKVPITCDGNLRYQSYIHGRPSG